MMNEMQIAELFWLGRARRASPQRLMDAACLRVAGRHWLPAARPRRQLTRPQWMGDAACPGSWYWQAQAQQADDCSSTPIDNNLFETI